MKNTIFVRVVAPKTNLFVMDHTREHHSHPRRLASKKTLIPGYVHANIPVMPHFVMDRINNFLLSRLVKKALVPWNREMKIWVDADACPVVIKEILFKAAERTGIQLTLVANQPVRVPPSRFISFVQVASGFDVADNEIVKRLETGDLVITGDIPLAADVIEKGGHALNPRGEMYTAENIKARLNIRDFMDTLRGSGIDTGGPPALSQGDRKSFADNLDRLLARQAGKE